MRRENQGGMEGTEELGVTYDVEAYTTTAYSYSTGLYPDLGGRD